MTCLAHIYTPSMFMTLLFSLIQLFAAWKEGVTDSSVDNLNRGVLAWAVAKVRLHQCCPVKRVSAIRSVCTKLPPQPATEGYSALPQQTAEELKVWERLVWVLLILPWPKKRTIVVMHHVISKNLWSDFAVMHGCVKSRQSQVAFARGSAAESSSMIPRYHKILILCINSMVLFLSRVVLYNLLMIKRKSFHFANQSHHASWRFGTIRASSGTFCEEHCSDCSYWIWINISEAVLSTDVAGEFKVLGSKGDWKAVNFSTPNCTCKDWANYELPCKHFFAVFRFHDDWGWSKLPDAYLNRPRMNIDISTVVSSVFGSEPDTVHNMLDTADTAASNEVVTPCADNIPKHQVNVTWHVITHHTDHSLKKCCQHYIYS